MRRTLEPYSDYVTVRSRMSEELELWGWERFFGSLMDFLRSSRRQFSIASENYTQYTIERFQAWIQSLTTISDHLDLQPDADIQFDEEERSTLENLQSSLNELITCCRSLHGEWEHQLDIFQSRATAYAYRVPSSASGRRGRPRFEIGREQLEHLSSLGFTWTDIANILQVSRMTLYRRRREYGMVDPVDSLEQDELETVLRQLRIEFPTAGEIMVQGQLRAMGYRISRERVRQAIRVTDPLNSAMRWRSLTPTRPYSVPSPNSLWHIGKDLVVFGGVVQTAC